MKVDVARWLEDEGWEVLSENSDDGLEARRQRGERVEVLVIGTDDRIQYALTRPIGEEEFRRVGDGERQCRVISRTYKETTVTTEATENSILADVRAAIQAATR